MTIIHDDSKPVDWRYVNREVNPADDESMGLKADALIKNDRWLTGPEFLWKDEKQWPKMIQIPCLKNDDPEVRQENQIYTTMVSSDVMERLIMYYSPWWKLKKAVAWLLRYKRFLMNKCEKRKGGSVETCEKGKQVLLRVQELNQAESDVLRYVQAKKFPEALADYLSVSAEKKNERPVNRLMKKMRTSLNKLNPKVEDGLLRVV